jgi:hypothetical protein
MDISKYLQQIKDAATAVFLSVIAVLGAFFILRRKGEKNVEKKVRESDKKIDSMPIDDAINDGNAYLRRHS